MNSELSTARIYTDFQGFSELRKAARDDSPDALREVAQQFEAVFIKMMLKSMRDASLADGIFESDQSEMYLGMFDQQLALELSSQQAFGIADMLVRQLGVQNEPINETTITPLEPASGTPVPVNSKDEPPRFESTQEFIQTMRPLAERAAQKLGIDPQVLIAQAALETGWGKKIIKNADGGNSHNLFGIKADSRWPGAAATVETLEYNGNVFKKEKAAFRTYGSYQQSFDDYVDFIQQGNRYRDALTVKADVKQYIHALQQAGYATDPHYADKVINIMEREVI